MITQEEIELYKREYDAMINEIYGSGYGCLMRMLNEQIKTNEGETNKDVTDFVHKDCKGILYHVCPSTFLKKIFKYSLMPKTYLKLGYQPERVYFTTLEQTAKNLVPALYNSIELGLYKHLKNEFSLLKIDLNRLSKEYSKPKFYLDPELEFAVYAHESINPNCIEIVKEIKVD